MRCPVCSERLSLHRSVIGQPLLKPFRCRGCNSLLQTGTIFLELGPAFCVLVGLAVLTLTVWRATAWDKLWGCAFAGLFLGGAWFFRSPHLLERARFACPGCGFDLTDNATIRCPECGRRIRAKWMRKELGLPADARRKNKAAR